MNSVTSQPRLLALGILLLAVAAAWLLVIEPVTSAFAAQDEEIAQAYRMLAAYEHRIALAPLVKKRLAQLKQAETSSTGTIGGASAELAAANIQNITRSVIEGRAGQVRSAQNLAPVTADGFQKIEIQYDVTLPMTKLKEIAYQIETSAPYLFLDSVDIRAPENWQIGPYQTDPPNLDVRWTVRGYRWAGAL